MYSWPRPIVYLPFETPSNTSKSASEMHCGLGQMSLRVPKSDKWDADSAGKVCFHCEDADILWTGELDVNGRHCDGHDREIIDRKGEKRKMDRSKKKKE